MTATKFFRHKPMLPIKFETYDPDFLKQVFRLVIDKWGLSSFCVHRSDYKYYSISFGTPEAYHREDGPAVIRFCDGRVYKKSYYQHDRLHRIGKPAVYQYHDDGTVRREYWQNGQRHREDGPATANLWYIRGVQVNEQIVLRPETQTIRDIVQEPNVEVKRIRIERYGWPKFLEHNHAKIIDRHIDDISGTQEMLVACTLYSALNQQDMHPTLLICSCPSTARVYAIEVPDRIMTCKAAQEYLRGEQLANVQIIGAS